MWKNKSPVYGNPKGLGEYQESHVLFGIQNIKFNPALIWSSHETLRDLSLYMVASLSLFFLHDVQIQRESKSPFEFSMNHIKMESILAENDFVSLHIMAWYDLVTIAFYLF